MIVELICHRMGWSSIWYANPGPYGLTALLKNKFELAWPGRWHVGVWTGPQNDLICVKHCQTNPEAEKYLSPSGPTATLACLGALWKAWRLGVGPKTLAEAFGEAAERSSKSLTHPELVKREAA